MIRRSRGFTLLEVLVAAFVTAMALTLGYGAINQVLTQRDRVHDIQRNIDALQRAVRMLASDFSQADGRIVRDPLGRGFEAAFRADSRTGPIVTFTRAGRITFAADTRGSLERVEYLLDGDKLVRRSWPVLDRTQSTTPTQRVLISGVRTFSLRFMAPDQTWLTQWPRLEETRLNTRPIAVEITVDTADFGKILRLIEVPG